MDNTEAIRELDLFRSDCRYYGLKGQFTQMQKEALSLAIQALKPLPTLAELGRVIENTELWKNYWNLHWAKYNTDPASNELTDLATAILDLLKGDQI